ncbi:hypothetical protein BGZ65_009252 [Modicella reniformis]|uniref:RRM domain-containing protein n=1 Tax=Modicella reniformis TaxID=1440133 RepID=A0A9P6IIY8_9FUNG|nr:hypothetical protein BGZ65_009252 [Modicella reniformis]
MLIHVFAYQDVNDLADNLEQLVVKADPERKSRAATPAEQDQTSGAEKAANGTHEETRDELSETGVIPNQKKTVYVGNLPFQCQWQDLKDLFRKAGPIIRADVALGYDGRSRGFGSVLFATPEDARNAISRSQSLQFGA